MKTIVLYLLLIFGPIISPVHGNDNDTLVKIHYLGHCAFILQFDDSISVLTDYAASYPYYSASFNSPIYNIYDFIPDIATYSHQHDDHYTPSRRPAGVSHVLQNNDELTIKDLQIKPVRTSEANVSSPDNSTYIFKYKGLTIVHTGDMTANIKAISVASQQQHIRELFPDTIDVLLYVMDGTTPFVANAEAFLDFLKPRIAIPMHYWTPSHKTSFLNYLKSENTTHGKTYEIEETNSADYVIGYSDTLQSPTRVVSLDPYPLGPPTIIEDNLATGGTTYASSTMDVNHSTSRSIDGYPDTRWQEPYGSTIGSYTLKLKETAQVSGIAIRWYSKVQAYNVLVSTDSINFDTVFTTSNNAKNVFDSITFDKREIKYINVFIKSANNNIGIYEMGVYENMTVSTGVSNLYIQNELKLNAYPNPAANQVNIQFVLQESGMVSLKLTGIDGKTQIIIPDQWQNQGYHNIDFNLTGLQAGIYIVSVLSNYQLNELLLIKR